MRYEHSKENNPALFTYVTEKLQKHTVSRQETSSIKKGRKSVEGDGVVREGMQIDEPLPIVTIINPTCRQYWSLCPHFKLSVKQGK